MPIYEYACASCGHRFELLRPMAQADAPAICAACKSQAKRVVSTPSVNTWKAKIIPPTGSGRQV